MVALHEFQSKGGFEAQDPPPAIEPVVINSVFITGMAIEIIGSTVRVTAWEQIGSLDGDERGERRIVARLAMDNDTARTFFATGRKALSRDGH